MAGDTGVSRRAALAGLAGGAAALAGCGGVLGASTPVSVLAAGSLQLALREGLAPAVEVPVRVEAHGSAAVARMVAEGQRDPDVVAVADPVLLTAVLDAAWYAEFASNAVVVAYNPDTAAGRRVGRADRWFDPILEGAATLGRTDPELDPLGYRTLFVLRLAAEYYGRPGLAAAVLRDAPVYPETELLSHFETGALDAAVVYRNMAVERGYRFLALPDPIDLSDPRHADRYATASYELPSGTVRGGVVSYAATALGESLDARTRTVFEALVGGDYLREFGFRVPASYPTYTGHVPDPIAP